jgi:hypothetical protein
MSTATADLWNTARAAAYLDKRPQTLVKWRCTKEVKLPYIEVGGSIRYRKIDLDAFLERKTKWREVRELQEV